MARWTSSIKIFTKHHIDQCWYTQCYQNINGKRILLDTGSVLLLDKGSSHSIEALGKNARDAIPA